MLFFYACLKITLHLQDLKDCVKLARIRDHFICGFHLLRILYYSERPRVIDTILNIYLPRYPCRLQELMVCCISLASLNRINRSPAP